MSTCFEAGRNDDIDTRILKGNRFVRCRRCANRHDAFRSTLIKDLFWRNSEDEAEDGYFFLQQNANLIFEFDRQVWLVFRMRCVQFLDVSRQRREASVEGSFV